MKIQTLKLDLNYRWQHEENVFYSRVLWFGVSFFGFFATGCALAGLIIHYT